MANLIFVESSGVFSFLVAEVKYDGQLSATAYIILAVFLLGITGGLAWCFYRALTAAGKAEGPQKPDEIGDENQQEG
ncbi:MAG: hypothetical protein ACYSRR_03355 [Planctomycetota bacterium]|jgi:hypothetical protein